MTVPSGVDIRAGLARDEREREQILLDALRATTFTMLPGNVSQSIDKDGRYMNVKIGVKRRTVGPDGNVSFDEYPELQTAIPHFPGGGGEPKDRVLTTHPLKKGKKDDGTDSDEVTLLFGCRGIDNWEGQGGAQNPTDNRRSTGANLSDVLVLPGLHSKPNLPPFYDPDAHQTRSHIKDHVVHLHPHEGVKTKSASKWKDGDDPFAKATEFFHHLTQAAKGIESIAARDKTQHQDFLNHDAGFTRNVGLDGDNDKHHYNLHPSNGHEHSWNHLQHSTIINADGHKQDFNFGQAQHIISMLGHLLQHKGISHQISDLGHTLSAASQAIQILKSGGVVNITAATNIINSSPLTKISKLLDVGGLAQFAGGLSSGALEVAADADGGLVHATMGFQADGGATVDTLLSTGLATVNSLRFNPLPHNCADDGAASSAGVPVGGVYRTGSTLMVRTV
jgi:hypothetical protein